jgi:hypothetical protein
MVKGDVTPGKTVCICDWCDAEFSRRTADVKQSLRHGMKQFCNGACAVRWSNAHPTERMRESAIEVLDRYRKVNHKDEFTPFRYFHKNIRNRRMRNGDFREIHITKEDLMVVWNEQGGICPYSGIKLVLPDSSVGWGEYVPSYKKASLDRIDSSKGYSIDNIQFVSQIANLAKNVMSHEEMVEFCKQIASHWLSSTPDS